MDHTYKPIRRAQLRQFLSYVRSTIQPQMPTNSYTALSQLSDDGLDKEHLLPTSDDSAQGTSVEVPRGGTMSSQWIVTAVIILLFINASCLLVTMQQLQLGSRVLKQFVNYADNRDLPRLDPYAGL